jgi:hypothetical protein
VSITRRLFSPFKRQAPSSAYVYMPPKHTWWRAIAAFAAGAVCVFALVRSPAAPPAPDASPPVPAVASASQVSSLPQAFLAAPAESARAPTDAATAAVQPSETASATPANAKANVKRTASRSAHRQTAKKSHRYDSPFQSFAGNFNPFGGGNRGQGRRYSGGGFGYGYNAN